VPAPPEVEPLPPLAAEDEDEEIGRPEGPLEERHIDPFAMESEETERHPAEPVKGRDVRGLVRPDRSLAPREEEPIDEEEPQREPAEPPARDEPAEPPAPSGTPRFGRRPGKARR
jgi:hypothetical protein